MGHRGGWSLGGEGMEGCEAILSSIGPIEVGVGYRGQAFRNTTVGQVGAI